MTLQCYVHESKAWVVNTRVELRFRSSGLSAVHIYMYRLHVLLGCRMAKEDVDSHRPAVVCMHN